MAVDRSVLASRADTVGHQLAERLARMARRVTRGAMPRDHAHELGMTSLPLAFLLSALIWTAALGLVMLLLGGR